MERVEHDFHTEIFPSDEEIHTLCKIGQGADTCVFLVVGAKFECMGLNKRPMWSFIERARRGETTAQREGCKEVTGMGP